MQRALDLRTALTAAGGCAFAAQAEVNYGEEIFRFSMDCAYEAGGGVTIRLTEPQTLAGIGAEVSADGARVAYEDTEVGFAELAGGRVSPMRLPYLLAESWYRGYISACGWEDGVLRATYLLGYGYVARRLRPAGSRRRILSGADAFEGGAASFFSGTRQSE